MILNFSILYYFFNLLMKSVISLVKDDIYILAQQVKLLEKINSSFWGYLGWNCICIIIR